MTDPGMHRPLPSITRRERLVREMAAYLIECDAISPRLEAFHALIATGRFSTVDVVICIDDARQAAAQVAVAKEMTI